MKRKNIDMRILLKPFQLLYAVYAIIAFVVLMIPVFIWSVMVLPFGRIKGGNLIYYGCMVWADIWCAVVFIRHRNIYKEPLGKGKSYIFVANHISYIDAALIPKILHFPIRALGKVEMAKVPVFGFIYRNAIVTVDRSSAANRIQSVQMLKAVLRKGISILVFPEGTFNTTGRPVKDFYDGAFRIAIETGTPIKPILILHAYDRMHYSSIFTLNPGISRAVFLPQVPVEGLTLQDVAALKAQVRQKMETALIAHNASWIKSDVEK
jgi:1-acyl-sn-glycerol-3-phosphate acyltransferase